MKPPPPTIVCAHNLSARSHGAVLAASRFALRWEGVLRLVHVTAASGQRLLTEARVRLEHAAAPLRTSGISVETVLLEGTRLAPTLIDFLRREPPALVVVSATLKGPLDRWALGSFSEDIAEDSPVPTLVVHDASPFESWEWTKSRLRVLAALDLHQDSVGTLRWIHTLGRGGPYEVVPCHIDRHPIPPHLAPSAAQERQQMLEREVRKQVRDHLGCDVPEVAVIPSTTETAAALAEAARRFKADLIVTGAHQRHGLNRLFHGSVTRSLLHRTATNVVCVPAAAVFDPREAPVPEFRRVLVATDFSPAANAAVPFACAACGNHGLVKVIHVTHPAGLFHRTGPAPDLRGRLEQLLPKSQPGAARVPRSRCSRAVTPPQPFVRRRKSLGRIWSVSRVTAETGEAGSTARSSALCCAICNGPCSWCLSPTDRSPSICGRVSARCAQHAPLFAATLQRATPPNHEDFLPPNFGAAPGHPANDARTPRGRAPAEPLARTHRGANRGGTSRPTT
jgi:nucleotide-binding universal stress UspA family protein